MKFSAADHTPEQHAALAIVNAWASPRFFDALLKEDNGRYTAAAATTRLELTNGEGQLRPLHIISEMISKDPQFAANVIEGDKYIRQMQAAPEDIGGVLEQQHEIFDAAWKSKDEPLIDKTAMHIRLINAVLAEASRGITPAAIATQKDARGNEGLAV